MPQRLSLLLVLILALMPSTGGADTLAGTTPLIPIRSPVQGFSGLFRSPVPPVVPGAVNAIPLTSTAAIGGFRQVPPNLAGTNPGGEMCRPAIAAAEARHGVPPGLLQAIGIVESGRRDPISGVRQPWPWTINAEGEPHVFETKEQAVSWVRQAQSQGMRSIDVGCTQVNLKHHPDAFMSLEQAFDPAANADYAARFLKELHDTAAGGNWMTAAGYYHSQTPERAEPYRQMVQAAMTRDTGLPAPALASASAPTPPFAAAGAVRSFGRAPLDPGRPPSASPGRGLDAYRAVPIQMAGVLRPTASIQAYVPVTGEAGTRPGAFR